VGFDGRKYNNVKHCTVVGCKLLSV